MVLGIVIGLIMIGLIFLYVLDEVNNASPLFVLLLFGLMIVSVVVGFESHTKYEVKKQIKPTIKVVIENGKSDTTYIYKFEEVK